LSLPVDDMVCQRSVNGTSGFSDEQLVRGPLTVRLYRTTSAVIDGRHGPFSGRLWFIFDGRHSGRHWLSTVRYRFTTCSVARVATWSATRSVDGLLTVHAMGLPVEGLSGGSFGSCVGCDLKIGRGLRKCLFHGAVFSTFGPIFTHLVNFVDFWTPFFSFLPFFQFRNTVYSRREPDPDV
jgi:hypothetical protein